MSWSETLMEEYSSKGITCWELVRLAYSMNGGPELPEHAEIDADDLPKVANAIETGKRGGPWHRVTPGDEAELDVVTVNRLHGRRLLATHVGVVTGTGMMLHTDVNGSIQHVAFRDTPTRRAEQSVVRMVDGIWRHMGEAR